MPAAFIEFVDSHFVRSTPIAFTESKMSRKLVWCIALSAATVFCPGTARAALLLDFFGGVDPTTHQDWADAGVPGDTSTFAGGTITGIGGVFNITGGMTATVTGGFSFNGGAFANGMLTDYRAVSGFNAASVSIGGFDNTLTSSLGDMAGNTFTMQPDTNYTLILFGAGDTDGQDSTFTFNGVSKTTSSVIVGTADDAGHSVAFDFTTPASLVGYTIDFTFQGNSSQFAAWNGAAITATAVPEPASIGFVAASGLLFVAGRRIKQRHTKS